MAIHTEGRVIRRYQDVKGMNRVDNPLSVPNGPHFAVIIYKTEQIHIPGDERSRQCPGHGYPAETRTFNVFEHWVTTDESALNSFLRFLDDGKWPFAFFSVLSKGTIKKEVVFEVRVGK